MQSHKIFDMAVDIKTFGLERSGSILGYRNQSLDPLSKSLIPEADPTYVFQEQQLGIMSAWWESANEEPLFISGPHGSGKTSFVNQFCARVGAPVVSLTARSRLDRTDLTGHWVIGKDKSMSYVDGPITRAWKHGYVFVANEMSAAPADFWLSINELLEGAPLFLEETGEVIKRHPRARIIMTDNIRGITDDAFGRYLGRNVQDPAVMDRCWKLRLEYIDADSEIKLIESKIPEVEVHGIDFPAWKKEFAKRLRKAAERVREAYCGINCSQPIEATISTRVLLRLKDLLLISCTSKDLDYREALHWALRVSLTESVDPASALTVEKLVEAELGSICSHLSKPVSSSED
ncbi:MAG: MoxR family ATPase [Burkholderiales bacterium]|nr:MoxR family ATPase [Burkholderiales bacterium]